jgi:CRISPR system Cascade subunit CasA
VSHGPRIIGVSALLIAIGAAAAGCVSYEARPVDLAVSAGAIEARTVPLPTGGTLRYLDALDLALQRAPAVLQARAAYDSAVAAARTARVRQTMTLTLTAEYSRQADPNKPWLYGGALDAPLDRGRGSRIDSADLAVLKVRYDLIEAVWTTRTALRRALFDQAIAEQELAVADRQIAVRQERLAVYERRVSLGEDARAVALTAATELSLSRQRRTLAAAALVQARAAIAAQLGVTVEALGDIQTATPEAARPEAGSVPALRRDAALGRADVLKTVVDYDIAEQALRTAVAGKYPQITLSPGYTWERGITKLPFNLGLALPPMDLNRAAIHEAEVKRAEAGVALEAAQAKVFAEVDAATSALAGADRQAARIEAEDRPLAARAMALTDRAVALGENDRTDALAAEASGLDVDLSAIDVRRRQAAALADLEAATRVVADPAERDRIAAALPPLETAP